MITLQEPIEDQPLKRDTFLASAQGKPCGGPTTASDPAYPSSLSGPHSRKYQLQT